MLDEADRLVTRSTRPDYWDARLRSIRAGLLHDAGRVEDALAMSDRAAQIAAACGDTFNELQNRHYAVNMLLDLGRLSDADKLAAAVIAACTDDTRRIEHIARRNRAGVAVERGDRALCAATARRLLAEADGLGLAVDAEHLLTLADPVTYAPQIKAALAVDPAHPGEWVLHLEAQTCVATAALVAGDYERAVTVASDIVVIAEALPLYRMFLSGLVLMGDAALLCGDRPQALTAYRQALVRANQQSFVLRAADAVDGLTRMIAGGDDRRMALATADQLRRTAGAARLPRPWLPSLDTPRRTAAEHPPPDWMNGRRLSDAGVAAIIASAADSLTAGHVHNRRSDRSALARRASRRRTGRRWPHQSRDRRTTAHRPTNRRDPHRARLPEARRPEPDPARPTRRQLNRGALTADTHFPRCPTRSVLFMLDGMRSDTPTHPRHFAEPDISRAVLAVASTAQHARDTCRPLRHRYRRTPFPRRSGVMRG